MRAFDYHRPSTLKQAVSLLRKLENAQALAGGQSLIPALKMRLASPAALVDLGAIEELRGIRLDGGVLTIGAAARHAEVAAAKDAAISIPALAKLAGGIGDGQVRNLGTLGGALANNDPAADYPAAVLGLGATVNTSKRTIAADRFFTGLYETALKPGEIITSVAFPLPRRAAYVKFRQPASRFAIVGVFVSEGAGSVRVAVTGAAGCVFRAKAMEKKLVENFSPDAITKVKMSPEGLNSDIHASAEYRAHLVTVLAQRAVAAAIAGK
ncbi:MAG: xanthine dehydrogenase family protein subunit M [Betaproteobacteria bacterium]|nr:xanthine dehydrogenase family protein subunit M [Betaproteobacteria bacterium]